VQKEEGDTVSETTVGPAFEVVLPQPPETKWQEERRAFLRLVSSLLPTHRGQYVAIHEGKVVESGPDKVAVGLRAYAKYGYIPIYVGLVTDEPARMDRLPTPRPLRREASS
jgi:hypothetical protein